MPTHKIHSKYAGIGNDVLQSNKLSLKAKGLLGYLVSKPEGWDFSSVRMEKELREERKSIQRGLIELENAGLLQRERLATGRIVYHIYTSFELIEQKPLSQNVSEAKCLRGKKGYINNKFIREKKSVSKAHTRLEELIEEQLTDLCTLVGKKKEAVERIYALYKEKIPEHRRGIEGFRSFLLMEKSWTPDEELPETFEQWMARSIKEQNAVWN